MLCSPQHVERHAHRDSWSHARGHAAAETATWVATATVLAEKEKRRRERRKQARRRHLALVIKKGPVFGVRRGGAMLRIQVGEALVVLRGKQSKDVCAQASINRMICQKAKGKT